MKSHLLGALHMGHVGASLSFDKIRTWRTRFVAYTVVLCAALMAFDGQAAFQAFETFDSLALGNINAQNGWSVSGTTGEVVLDPAGGNNQALEVNTESGTLENAMSIAENTRRMLFLRLRFEEHGRYSFGVSFASNPAEFVDFSAELGMAAATNSDPANELRVANGSSNEIYDVLTTLTPGTWYNVWVLIDNSSDSYEVWVNSNPDGDAQAGDQLSNDAGETVFGFRTVIDDLQSFFIKTGGGSSLPEGRFYLDDIYLEDTDSVNLSNPVGSAGGDQPAIVASVLPSSRSTEVGVSATAFASVINADNTLAATDCSIAPVTSVAADFLYQTTDPTTNELTGTPNTPVDIPAEATQTFLIAFTPSASFAPTDVELAFDCTNSSPAPVISGVNTLLLSASSTAVPDIVALAATPTGDGIVQLPPAPSDAAFAVATANVGATGEITAAADTGDAELPLNLFICETDSTTGQCLSPPAASTTSTMNAGATATFTVFVNATGPVADDPAVNRIHVRFKDAGDVTRGSTSVAVRTQ